MRVHFYPRHKMAEEHIVLPCQCVHVCARMCVCVSVCLCVPRICSDQYLGPVW